MMTDYPAIYKIHGSDSSQGLWNYVLTSSRLDPSIPIKPVYDQNRNFLCMESNCTEERAREYTIKMLNDVFEGNDVILLAEVMSCIVDAKSEQYKVAVFIYKLLKEWISKSRLDSEINHHLSNLEARYLRTLLKSNNVELKDELLNIEKVGLKVLFDLLPLAVKHESKISLSKIYKEIEERNRKSKLVITFTFTFRYEDLVVTLCTTNNRQEINSLKKHFKCIDFKLSNIYRKFKSITHLELASEFGTPCTPQDLLKMIENEVDVTRLSEFFIGTQTESRITPSIILQSICVSIGKSFANTVNRLMSHANLQFPLVINSRLIDCTFDARGFIESIHSVFEDETVKAKHIEVEILSDNHLITNKLYDVLTSDAKQSIMMKFLLDKESDALVTVFVKRSVSDYFEAEDILESLTKD